jgi:hypothetical protein
LSGPGQRRGRREHRDEHGRDRSPAEAPTAFARAHEHHECCEGGDAHEQARDARARVMLRQRSVRCPRHAGDDVDSRVAGEERDRGAGHGRGECKETGAAPGITRPRDERDRE